MFCGEGASGTLLLKPRTRTVSSVAFELKKCCMSCHRIEKQSGWPAEWIGPVPRETTQASEAYADEARIPQKHTDMAKRRTSRTARFSIGPPFQELCARAHCLTTLRAPAPTYVLRPSSYVLGRGRGVRSPVVGIFRLCQIWHSTPQD